jgi:hypothetical protein
MVYRGTIKSGVVVLPADVTLPEGTEVLVALPDSPDEAAAQSPIWEKLTDLGRWAGRRHCRPTCHRTWPPITIIISMARPGADEAHLRRHV